MDDYSVLRYFKIARGFESPGDFKMVKGFDQVFLTHNILLYDGWWGVRETRMGCGMMKG